MKYELIGWKRGAELTELLEESDEMPSLADAVVKYQDKYDGLEVQENIAGQTPFAHKAWSRQVEDERMQSAIDQLTKLNNSATPPPWIALSDGRGACGGVGTSPHHADVCQEPLLNRAGTDPAIDMQLIVVLRNNLPMILAALAAYRPPQGVCKRCGGKREVVIDEPQLASYHMVPCPDCAVCKRCGGTKVVCGEYHAESDHYESEPCPDCSPGGAA